MKRVLCNPRSDFKQIVENQGLIWHDTGSNYWHESAYYQFSSQQISEIERATEECHQLFLAAGDYLVSRPELLKEKFQIPEQFVPHIIHSWESEPPCLNYGRFDFGYDGINPPKLFEYNCDTPTSMLEAGVIQWLWKEEVFPDNDQFNSLHDKMVEAYRKLNIKDMHFAGVDDNLGEDAVTIGYHMDLASEAGIVPHALHMSDIGVAVTHDCFLDQDNRQIRNLFKLYPWEWLIQEEFGQYIPRKHTNWIEPMWKMLWSNKAILPILWELNPGHPNLLKTTFDAPYFGSYVKKPALAREGANVTIVDYGVITESDGTGYEDNVFVYQDLYRLPKFDGKYPVIGSWCVNGWAAGMGIRESGLITNNQSQFTPHIIV